MAENRARDEIAEARSLAPWSPFGELEPWSRLLGEWPFTSRLPRLADELFREWPRGATARPLLPALDVSEDDERYTVSVELPGTRKQDVHVELQEGVLEIRGEKKSERAEKKERHRYVERCYGSFSRSFRLPPDADAEHLEASFKDGVLTITIPRTGEAKPRTLAIK